MFNHATNTLGNHPLFNQEAFQHGFLTGILINFRYRMNLKSYVEIISGRGYADMILLIRGEGRSFSSTPMLVELKRSSIGRTNIEMAHQEAQWYARALRKNKMRMLTDANNIICIGLDMRSRDDPIITTNAITDPRSPLLTRLINLAINNLDTEELISPDGTRTRLRGEQGIRTLIGEAYYGFPSVEDAHNRLSRFIVGQALAISRLSDRISLETQFSSANNITTLVALLTNQSNKNALVIFNIKEAGRQNELLHERLPRLSDNTLDIFHTKNITKVVEINIRGYTHAIAQDGSPSPRRYFIPNDNLSITHYRNIAEYKNSIINRSSTSFLRDIPVSTSIANRFRNAIEHQHGRLKQQINELEDRLVQNSIKTIPIGMYEPLLRKIKSLIRMLPMYLINH
ncbi:MAG: hypothetical protein KTV77_05480, partial [Wolbachia endosymbiont of Fragariocoptes setiger]|nr:hypothetical protein [Wolbachia endosymbiont of Fragariocoptes setiger]